jgi:hypothetical protein
MSAKKRFVLYTAMVIISGVEAFPEGFHKSREDEKNNRQDSVEKEALII